MSRFSIDYRNPNFKNALKLAGLQSGFWIATAFANYQTVYLQKGGMSASSLGVLNSLGSFVGIFAVMFWGMISDKINSIKKTFMISMVLGAALMAGLPFLPTGWKYATLMFMIYCPFVNFFRSPGGTLLDNLTIRNCNQQGLDYGSIRATGSFFFTVACFVITAIVTRFGVNCSFWLAGILMIFPFLLLFRINDPKFEVKHGEKKASVSPKPLFKNYFYIAFLIFVVISYITFNAEYCFMTYLMQDRGVNIENYGVFNGIRALCEVPALLLIVKLRQKFKLKYIIITAVTLMGTECFLLGLFAHTFPQFLMCGAVFGLGNGLYIGSAAAYVYKLAPANLKASAQSIYASVASASGIVANFTGGFVFQRIGGEKFYILLGSIAFASIIIWVLSFVFAKGKYNPGDELGLF
ncbi:MAG: MFS transporter [Clostridia bacterium]|nr:MFS transporter [Clostridia bacterium]